MFFLETVGLWLVNLTPHPIVVELSDGSRVEIPTHGEPIRLAENRTTVAPMIDRVEYTAGSLPDPAVAPDFRPVFYVVSNPVAQAAAAAGRKDFIAPDTSRGIRDGDGKIVAVRGFITF